MQRELRKTGLVALACGLLLTSMVSASQAFVVTITSIDGETSNEVMTREAIKSLSEQIKKETSLFPKAVAAARAAWESNDLTKGEAFPAAKLKPRTFRQEGPFPLDQARKKVDQRNDRAMNREFAQAAKRTGNRKNKPSDREIAKQERKLEREALVVAAAEVVNKELEKLLKGE